VQPGECYAVSVRVYKTGQGAPALTLRWKTPEQQWTAEDLDQTLAPAQAEQWCEIVTLVRVPEGVGQLAVLLGVRQQTGAADVAEFDDVRLVQIQK
jgi:hypothetical protein